jgi:hypothetical protein
MFTCPVCFYNRLQDPPEDYNICVCCGTEFGNDDEFRTYTELRQHWIATGAKWFFCEPPLFWNPWKQLTDAGATLPYSIFISLGSSIPEYAAAVWPQAPIYCSFVSVGDVPRGFLRGIDHDPIDICAAASDEVAPCFTPTRQVPPLAKAA